MTITADENAVLLDTNIVIYLINDATYAERYRPHIEGKKPMVSFMTVAELYEGAFRAGMETRSAKKIIEAVTQYPAIRFNSRICEIFGRIRAASRNKPISVPDALIAATALAYELPLITHNESHFTDIAGLKVISEYRKEEQKTM